MFHFIRVNLRALNILTRSAQTLSTSAPEKPPDTYDETSPADFYGLFIDTSRYSNKDDEARVSIQMSFGSVY